MPDPATTSPPGYWATVDSVGTQISTRFLAALAGSHDRVTRIDVYNGTTFLETLPTVTGGTVTVDETASVRRTCAFTLVSQGRDLDNLVPKLPTDLLNPASGNELHIFRGIQYTDGTQDLCQLGVFRMSKPVVDDSGDAITISISGSDRSATVSRIKWTGAYTIARNTDLATAIKALVASRWPAPSPLTFDVVPTNPVPDGYLNAGQFLSVPTTTFGLALATGNDPWADAVALAANAGMDLYFDVFGTVVMRPFTTTSGLSTTFDGLYEEGVTCTMSHAVKTLDETAAFNGVIAIGSGTAGNNQVPPIQPVHSKSTISGFIYSGIWNTDPKSATYYDPSVPGQSEWGPVPYIFETTAIPGYKSIVMYALTTAGSSTLTGITDALGHAGTPVGLVIGAPITGDPAFIASGTTNIFSVDGGAAIAMSAPAVATSFGPITITGGGPADTQGEAQSKIDGVAAAMLTKILSVLDDTTFDAIVNPALWENDAILVLRERIGISSTSSNMTSQVATAYLVRAFSIPLDASSAMSVTCKPQAASS